MKNAAVILLILWLGMGLAFGQKGKIKGDVPNETPDTVVADGGGKAAIRGAMLMQEARDSLRANGVNAPTDVVDTFGVDTQAVHFQRSFLNRADLKNAYDRIADARLQLTEADSLLQLAKKDARYTTKQLEEAQQSLDAQKQSLAATEEKFEVLRSDWETTTGLLLFDKPDSAKIPETDSGTAPK